MKCPNCGAHILGDTNFCDNCGKSNSSLSKTATLKCMNCGTDNVDTNRFCFLCGLMLHRHAEVALRLEVR